jgi:hypothetical protein
MRPCTKEEELRGTTSPSLQRMQKHQKLLGDEPAQLHRIADATEAHLHRVQKKKNRPQWHLKQAQEEVMEQRRVAQQEKDDLQTKFEEDKAQI